MRRLAAVAASAILATSLLAGCGGDDDTADFCGVAEDISNDTSTADMTQAEVQDSLAELLDSAPDEIKDDLEVVRDALDDPSSVDTGQLQEAGDNLDAYVKDECDIDLSS